MGDFLVLKRMTEGVGREWTLWQSMKLVAWWKWGPSEPQFRDLGINYPLPLGTRKWQIFRKNLSANHFRKVKQVTLRSHRKWCVPTYLILPWEELLLFTSCFGAGRHLSAFHWHLCLQYTDWGAERPWVVAGQRQTDEDGSQLRKAPLDFHYDWQGAFTPPVVSIWGTSRIYSFLNWE